MTTYFERKTRTRIDHDVNVLLTIGKFFECENRCWWICYRTKTCCNQSLSWTKKSFKLNETESIIEEIDKDPIWLYVYLHLYVENKLVHLRIDENSHEKRVVLLIWEWFHYYSYDSKQNSKPKDIVHVVINPLRINDDQVLIRKKLSNLSIQDLFLYRIVEHEHLWHTM